jgi:hypothetical protein
MTSKTPANGLNPNVLVVLVFVVISVVVAAGIGFGFFEWLGTSTATPQIKSASGGGGSCPNPSFTFNAAIYNPPPDIGWPAAVYYAEGGCFHFEVYTPYTGGGPLPGALVNISVWPVSGPGSLGSPPPANWSCSTPPGGEPGGCVYIPPPLAWADGVSNASGWAAMTVGVPMGNYTVSLHDWIAGTDSGGGGLVYGDNETVSPLTNIFQPVNYYPGSNQVALGVYYADPNGAAPLGYSAAYYLTSIANGSLPNPPKGPIEPLGHLTRVFSVYAIDFPSSFMQNPYAELVGLVIAPDGQTVVSEPLYSSYFETPVSA